VNPFQVVARNPSAYRLMLRCRALIEWAERVSRRLTRERFGVMDLVGMGSIRITVPGRKTGVPRTCTLQYVPDGEDYLVVGSNWGRAQHPTWSVNFMASSRATVRHRGSIFTASLRSLDGPERERAWARILDYWPNYAIALDHAGGREFRLFALRRVEAAT